MRILALDWGTVRIGGAISDPEGKIAFPLEKFFESKNAVAEIKQLVTEKQVEKIVIGQPLALSGGQTKSSEQATSFGNKLRQELGLDIEFIDERLSSVGAGKILKDLGLSQKQSRGHTDNLAAAQLLQSYLDTKNL